MWIPQQLKNVLAVFLIDLQCAILSCFSANIVEQHFTKQSNLVMRGSVLPMLQLRARSKLECASLCLAKGNCMNYRYNTSTQICYTPTHPMPNGDTIFYNRGYSCPGDKGYILWIFPGMELCLMYNPMIVQNDQAKQHCANDGGHLLLIESDTMQLHVKTALEEMDVTGSVHMDGFKLPDNSVIAWNNKPFTWLKWDGGNPGGAIERCLHGELQGGFLARDNPCSKTIPFVCQIDI